MLTDQKSFPILLDYGLKYEMKEACVFGYILASL